MTGPRTHTVLPALFALLLLAATGAAAYGQSFGWLAVPVLIPACFWLLQHPVSLFYLLLAVIPWSIEYNFSDTLGTDFPDEPLMLLCAAAVLMIGISRRTSIRIRNLHPLLFLLLLQFGWTALTALLSTHPLLSVKHLAAKSWYLLAFVALPLYLFREEERIWKGARILLASMMLFLLWALLRHAQFGWSFESTNEALSPFYRNHVTYSSLLVLMVPLQVAFLHRLSGSKKRWWIALMALTIVALYLSYARGAWLALAAGMLAYTLLRMRLLVAAYVTALLVVAGAVYWLKKDDRYLAFSHDYNTTVFHTDFSEHLVATYQLKDVSTAERYYRWIAGVRMAKDSWQTGFGPATFYQHYKSYTVPAFKTWVSRNEERSTVHNYPLLLLIEQGLPGITLFLFLFGALFWYAQRIYHRSASRTHQAAVMAVTSMLVMIFVVNFLSDLIENDKVGSMFYLCIAGLVALGKREE